MNIFKHLTKFHTNVYFTNVACEKLSSNLKFYRSLNTRKPPSDSLYSRVKDCMVSYSAATTDNSVGRVGYHALDRVFNSDNRSEAKKQKLQREIAEFEQLAATRREEASRAQENMIRLLSEGNLDSGTVEIFQKTVKGKEEQASLAETEAGERQRELSSLNLQPSGSQVAAQIKAKVEQFIESMKTGGAESLEERRNFNNWLMQLNVRVTVLDAKLPMLQWSNTEAVIYRYPSGDIICDETISDMRVFGFSEQAIEQRKNDIKREQKIARLTF